MRLIPFLLCINCLGACAQPNNDIVIGKKENIYSKLLNEKREIWVHLPSGANNSLFGSQRYPVLYLLDGDAHFFSVAGMVEQFSEINGNSLCPEMIVVGIPNTNRTRDLTPTRGTAYTDTTNLVGDSGGGEKFMSFIEKELTPYIDSLYPTAPFRLIIGHSLGGLTVINTLIHHNQIFNAYLAIDPSMWWDRQALLKQAGSALKQNNFQGKTLFLGIANTMSPGMDTSTVRKDTTGNTLHIRSILLLADALNKEKGNGLRWEDKYYKEDDHGSVPLISEYDGLRFIFAFYEFKDAYKLFDSTYNAVQAVYLLSDHYINVSRQMGYTVFPPESYVNSLGYSFLQSKMNEKALSFFKMNLDNYPKSENVYDSMGDYYDAAGDKNKAIEYFRQALTVKENADTRAKLEKLEQKK
jgi:uncharacterized protein